MLWTNNGASEADGMRVSTVEKPQRPPRGGWLGATRRRPWTAVQLILPLPRHSASPAKWRFDQAHKSEFPIIQLEESTHRIFVKGKETRRSLPSPLVLSGSSVIDVPPSLSPHLPIQIPASPPPGCVPEHQFTAIPKTSAICGRRSGLERVSKATQLLAS